jgi:predicted transposase YbfD/YdcC
MKVWMSPEPSLNCTDTELHLLKSLQARFAQVPDSRQQGKVLHRLDEVLMVALCAVICNCDSFTDMADFARFELSWLRGFLTLEHGAPSHDVFRNVLLALQPQALLDILTGWCGELSGKHVAIDGKALRGTHNAEQGKYQVHLVRAWVDAYSLSAGQVTCAEKSNEIEAIPRLLASLSLQGATVTIDAMGTQSAIAEQIHAAGADYVLALKANQKGAFHAVAAHFNQPERVSQSSVRQLKHATLELSHGRCERRHYAITDELGWFDKSWKWAGLQSVAEVRRSIQRSHSSPMLEEVHYFLCSFKADAQRLAKLVRGHWSVENRCHWVLDVTFREDHCQVRDKNGAHNFSILREMAMKALRSEPSKLSLRRKRRRASHDPDFRLKIFSLLHA